jgi:hypothetical protein
MVYGCGNKCTKILVIAFNAFFCIAGIVILGVGIYANLQTSKFQELVDKIDPSQEFDVSTWRTAIWVLVAIGGFIFLTGFLGCCGAATENSCLLSVFFTVVLILFLAELAAGIAVLAFKSKVHDEIQKVEDIALREASNSTEARSALNKLEEVFDCCARDMNGTLDTSCAAKHKGAASFKCWDRLVHYALIIGIVALVILVVELFAMCFSCALIRAFRQDGYAYA